MSETFDFTQRIATANPILDINRISLSLTYKHIILLIMRHCLHQIFYEILSIITQELHVTTSISVTSTLTYPLTWKYSPSSKQQVTELLLYIRCKYFSYFNNSLNPDKDFTTTTRVTFMITLIFYRTSNTLCTLLFLFIVISVYKITDDYSIFAL